MEEPIQVEAARSLSGPMRRFQHMLLVERIERETRPVARLLIVAGTLLAIAMGAPLSAAIAVTAYLLVDQSWKTHLHRMAAEGRTVSRARYVGLLAHHSLITVALLAVSLALIASDWPYSAVTGATLMVSQAFHHLIHTSRNRDQMLICSIMLGAAAQVFAHMGCFADKTLAGGIVVHSLLAMMTVFGMMTGLRANRIQLQLDDALYRVAVAERGETVGRLTGGLAHDFRNLLTVMRGNLDLVAEVEPEERPQLLSDVRRATERGEQLIARLLMIGRPLPAPEESVDLDRFLTRFITFVQRVIPSNIAIDLHGSAEGIALNVDAAALEAALLNILLNARDAMPDGGRVDMRVDHVVGMSGTWARLSLRDTGPGMAPDVLARVVEPHVTSKPPGAGSGMGLAMVQDFAEGAGGRMEIDTAPDRGTEITLMLPC